MFRVLMEPPLFPPSPPTCATIPAMLKTGFGVELGSGLTYTSPGSGISLSAAIRDLLSNQGGEDGIAFREWGVSGSIRYDRGDDDLGLTVAISPAWGATGSRADELRSEAGLPWATAGSSTSNSAGGWMGRWATALPPSTARVSSPPTVALA